MLFSLFVDNILEQLEKSGLGCFINYKCHNSMIYADDLILVSISVHDLQCLFNICDKVISSLDLVVNINKCFCMRIGPRHNIMCKSLTICNSPIPWVTEIRYLGIFICKGPRFKCNWKEAISRFYSTTNNILGKIGSSPPLEVVLKLIVTQCLPILNYGNVACALSRQDIDKFCFVFNSVFCKLFDTKDKNTIQACQYYTGFLTYDLQYELNRLLFITNQINVDVIQECVDCDQPDLKEFSELCTKFKIDDNDSIRTVKDKVWCYFKEHISVLVIN